MAEPVAGLTSRSAGAVQTTTALSRLAERLAARWWAFAEAERESLPLWLPVAFAAGIAAWFLLPFADDRLALAVALAGFGLAGLALRLTPVAAMLLLALAGMGAAELRSRSVAHPVLAARTVASFSGTIEAAEVRAAREQLRLVIRPDSGAGLFPEAESQALVRVTLRGRAAEDAALQPGARLRLRAMLSPPAGAAVPGGYDFARNAWFAGIGATGLALGAPAVLQPAPPPSGLLGWLAASRAALTRRIQAAVPGEAGAVTAVFVTGDRGAVPLDTADTIRDSGLAHLLSISGLHIAVVVGSTILIVRRLLALFPFLALRLPVKTIAFSLAAVTGLGYTVLAGAEVPTIRSILATLIVLIGIMAGRQAFSLRLLAAAAFLILAVRPEVLLGPSFQLSFAAVTAIVALYESPFGRRLNAKGEDDAFWAGPVRFVAALIATGLVAEVALSAIGLFHFNQSGLYGVIANLFAIPLSSFGIIPMLMLALLVDALGLGTWGYAVAAWLVEWLILIANTAAGLPGAVVRLPSMPMPAFACIIAGGLWLALWRTRVRWWGAAPIALGLAVALAAPTPDLLVSADGRHAALRLADGHLAFLRPRASGFLREMWGNAVASDEGDAAASLAFAEMPGMACTPDACLSQITRGGHSWRLLATLSRDHIPRARFEPACVAADIIISDRRLPRWCSPRWLKLDRAALERSGALTIHLATGRIVESNPRLGDHPWRPRAAPRRRFRAGG